MKLIIIVVLLGAFIGLGYYKFHELTRPLALPLLDTNKYWGAGDGKTYKPVKTISEFKVNINEAVIVDLQQQLNRTFKVTEPLEGIKFEYGFNGEALRQLVDYWRDNYLPRWKSRQAFLNGFPQYTTEIQGLKIHFIHAKPSESDAKKHKVLPLLLLHGWPGSVREFYDFIPLLTKSSSSTNYVFEVIAPSLVGYGWSQAAPKPGFNAAEMAIVMRNLMLRLGHEKFLVQGGDWGSIIGSHISTIFGENVIGYHSNMCMLQTPLALMKSMWANRNPEHYLPNRFFMEHHFPLMDKFKMLLMESGYFHLQATKPDTIGHALTTSPIGLAAYILEKFQTVTGPGRNQKFSAMHEAYTIDAVLDNVMIYYLTNTATSAGRLYAENVSKEYRALQLDRVQSFSPMGCIRFKHDLPSALDWALKDKYPNFIQSKYVHHGGHFAAMEEPVILYIDFAEFVDNIPTLKQTVEADKKEEL